MSSGCSFIFDLFENHAGSVPHLFDLAHDIPITALDISPKGEILCVGDEHGNIGFWDIGGHKEIKLIRGCFSSPVTVISALPSTEKPRFACSDADGHFYFLSLNKFLFTYREEKTIISDGRLGFITCFSMVQPAEDFPHPTDSLNMFAFATYDIVLWLLLKFDFLGNNLWSRVSCSHRNCFSCSSRRHIGTMSSFFGMEKT